MRVTFSRFAAVVAVALSCIALAGCGGSGSPDQGIIKSADQLQVTSAEVDLAKAVENGTESDMFDKTQSVVSAIQQARSDGVSSAWLDKEVNSAESDVEIVGCHDCFTALEDAR